VRLSDSASFARSPAGRQAVMIEHGLEDPPSSSHTARAILERATTIVYIGALAVWAGGLVVLGAIVAPVVFGLVPAPTSADAMLVVFRRFDLVAMTCAVFVLLSEALLAWLGDARPRGAPRPHRRPGASDLAAPTLAKSAGRWGDIVRVSVAVIAAGLAIFEGLYLSPAIQALHRGGALRGFEVDGLALERLHRQAESTSKAELGLLFVLLVLVIPARRPT
jgi:hypothetical protein